jgi:hypothetical protein
MKQTQPPPEARGSAPTAFRQGKEATVEHWCRSSFQHLTLALFDWRRVRSVMLGSAALAAVGYCILMAVAPPEPVPEPFLFDKSASWISTAPTQQASGCFRLDLWLPSKVSNAWITLATNGGFEVLANGNSRARFLLGSPTSPFQKGLSEVGQKLTPADPTISVHFPREYQWLYHDNAELPVWVDLTSVLHPGHNALCVEVETNGKTPALIVSGEVLLETGARIPIRSGTEWVAEPVPRNVPQDSWTDAESPVLDWNHARVLPWKRSFWRLVPKGAYEEPFRGKRIRSVAIGSTTWIEKELYLSDRPVEGFLRVATDTPFQIWINGRQLQPITHNFSVLGFGPWFIREVVRSPMDAALETQPEWLDPNEVATLLPGQQSENPLNGNRAVVNGGNNGRLSSSYTNLGNPDRLVPPALTRSRRTAEFLVYSITPLLRAGKNTIRIGLYKDEPEAVGLSREPFLAFDGGAQLADGSNPSFASDEGIRCFFGATDDSNSRPMKVGVDGTIEPGLLPAKQFFGYAYPDRPWFSVCVTLFFVCAGTLLVSTTRTGRLTRWLEEGQTAWAVLAGWIWAGVLLRSAMLERSEAIFWRLPVVPLLLMTIGLAGAALALVLRRKRKNREPESPGQKQGLLPKRVGSNWIWPVLVGSAIVLCFVVRAWQIDYQAPDDDEYASLQASLAIAKSGVPEYQDGIWYTRSPLYHYLAGAVAALTGGGEIYSLRLLSVFLSCATAALIWKMGKELTHSRFLALCAITLFAIHPYLIFTGHVARFYQQHQFLHLLGLYFFLRGFVSNSGMRDRYLAVLTFFAAALSQEITILQILPLAVCYFLFAQRRSWPDEIRLLVAAGCALALIGLDLAFYELKCLTALEGVSPRVEPRIGWCFDKPSNFFALLIGYSRLHIVLSAFLMPGFLLAWRRKKAVWTCLYLYLFLSVVVTNLLITNKGFRYEYYLIPVWILLCVHGIAECAKFLIPAWEQSPARVALSLGWLVVIICSWSPWRILGSYNVNLVRNPTHALRFVAENLRPGDRIAVAEPHPDAALIETGHSDYDLSVPILYDFVWRKRGQLVDRNTAAEVIGNIDELQQAFAKNERLWVVIDRYQMHGFGEKILWQYPAARVQLYLRSNARLVFRSYLWSVYLWDRNAGQYSSFRQKPGNWFE